MPRKSENYLLFASNRLEGPISTTNHAFSPATPIDHTYQCHVLFLLLMIDLKIGKGHRMLSCIQDYTAAYPGEEARYPHCY